MCSFPDSLNTFTKIVRMASVPRLVVTRAKVNITSGACQGDTQGNPLTPPTVHRQSQFTTSGCVLIRWSHMLTP